MKRWLGPILTLILLAGVGMAIYLSMQEQWTQASVVTVKGVIGSEKEAFFRDPRVVEALQKRGLRVEIQKAGSRQIASLPELKSLDFAFPAGLPAAEKIKREQGINQSYPVFYTPMVVASWKDIAEILQANGIVQQRDGVYYILDLRRLLEFSIARKRWTDLKDNRAYPVDKSILIGTTDVRSSNSAAMYLALASYVLNGNEIVASEEKVAALIDTLASLFTRQGYQESSSAGPFDDYLVMGPGKAPLVMIYEAQFLYEAARPDGGVNEKMALLYPAPTVFTKHVLIPFNPNGAKLGEALAHDPDLQRLAIEHGFRGTDRAAFRDFAVRHKLTVPEDLIDVVDTPSHEVLERMIVLIEQRYQ